MSITNAARRFEQRFDAKAERFIWHHPLLGFISIFVGMPLLVLACVCISTIVIAFPMAWLLGAYGIVTVQAVADVLTVLLAIPIIRSVKKKITQAEQELQPV